MTRVTLDAETRNGSALKGLRVVDFSSGVAGRYCARLMADSGADVTRIAPPRIDGLSTLIEPDLATYLDQHLDHGKRHVTLDVTTDAAVHEFASICSEADVIVVEHQNVSHVREHLEGRTVVVLVREFGAGERQDWIGCELIHQALGGAMYTTGRPNGPPVYGLGRRAYYATGVTAYISAMAALVERMSSGRGQIVDAVVEEAVAAMSQNLVAQFDYSQTFASRSAYPGMLAQIQALDGWLVLFALRGWRDLCDVFRLPHLKHDERFATPTALRRNWPDALAHIEAAARDRPCDELVDGLQAKKISAARAISVRELFQVEQYLVRGALPTAGQDAGEDKRLGPVFRSEPLSGSPHDVTSGRAWFGRVADAPSDDLPLKGIRVLDLTMAWAGPFATRALAFLGAEVIKIENARRLDSWRGPVAGMGDPNVYPSRDGGDDPYNRHSWFNTQNHDKQSVALDLKHPLGRNLAHRLADTCDVVIANFSPNVMNSLGLGYQRLSATNPGVILVEMPAFGNTGPWASHVGMGKTMEAASGMSSLMGYGDGEPLLTGPAFFDPVGGLHGAAAVLTALAGRASSGRGRYIEVPQVEAALHWIGEYILAASDGCELPDPSGNAIVVAEPHEAFPCRGEDEWIAIAIFNDRQWRTLADMSGVPELKSPLYGSMEGRRAQRALIASLISAWTRTEDKNDLSSRLQSAGVPAAPVRNGRDMHSDENFRTRQFVVSLDHPVVGQRRYSGLAYRLRRTPGQMSVGAPAFGQHTRSVLTTLLHLSEADVDQAIASGAAFVKPVMGEKS